MGRKYFVAVALLAALAVAFGLTGTAMPVSQPVSPQQFSSSDSVTHFMNPPTYDSDWLNIMDKCGQYFNVTHDLNTTEVFVDIVGKQSLSGTGGEHQIDLGGVGPTPGWSRTYGGVEQDWVLSMVQTSDGGYALAGYTTSFGVDLEDFWLVKTDASGNLEWNKTYGGPGSDVAYSMVQTSDGGYALAGFTTSFGADGGGDFWLVKTYENGTEEWSRRYGGSARDRAYSVVQTSDGGYALAGATWSSSAGEADFWLVKTYENGTEEWNKKYGGSRLDRAYSVVQTSNGGYALAGYSNTPFTANFNSWLVKTYENGTEEWNKKYGGAGYDVGSCLVQTSDGGYALSGYTESFGAVGGDSWLVKIYENGTEEWSKTYGGAGYESGRSVVQTYEGGYALFGYTESFDTGGGDFWLIKTDASGNIQWSKTYGGAGFDSTGSVVQTYDGGYALSGYTESFGAVGGDSWLVKTDWTGNMGAESGLAWTDSTADNITLYRGLTDVYWNYVRVRIWVIEEPTWMFGDINMDGVVDINDLTIVGQNYGKTFSILSLAGIAMIAGIHTYKKRNN